MTITSDNRDDRIQHNLHIRDTAAGDVRTDVTEGPDTQNITVTFDHGRRGRIPLRRPPATR